MCTILATVAPGVCPLTHLLYLTQPHLPEPCLYPELKPGSPHCLDLPLNPEPGLTLLGSMPESGLATLSLSLSRFLVAAATYRRFTSIHGLGGTCRFAHT